MEFITPSLLITNYYDSLISQLDIYTEETIKEIKERGLLKMTKKVNENELKTNYCESFNESTFGVSTFNNPYESQKYNIDLTDISITEISEAEDYANTIRQKAIDEIRKVQDENLEYFKANKEKFKVDRENLTEEKLEELKSQLFANRYCFLLPKNPNKFKDGEQKDRFIPIFNLHTVITDFYLRKSDIDYIRIKVDGSKKTTKLDQRFYLTNQVKKYIKERLDRNSNGYELIQIKQTTLLDIEHIEVSYTFETDLSRLKIDLSAIKSLRCLDKYFAKISDLSRFVNLEYLFICRKKLYEWPFENLHKLIKIDLSCCDLSEFDIDSINSLTSLQIIEIKWSYFLKSNRRTISIDLNRLVNLKWLDFSLFEHEKIYFELITNPSNQLTYLCIINANMDLSKQFYLPQLKCLHISTVDLSQQISKECFNGMTSLIELHLNRTNITDVEFLDCDLFERLEILDLSENKISELRKGVFSKLTKLKSLNLYANRIEQLVPGVFECLECLEELQLRFNNIDVKSIDKTVYDWMKSLKNFYISNYQSWLFKEK